VPVQLVVAADRADGAGTTSIAGRVVGLPSDTSSALGMRSLSVEVAADEAAIVAAADDVRVVLLEPSEDPAADLAVGDSGAADGGGP
jgi:glycine cleavage system pyridoxal-binding protein P